MQDPRETPNNPREQEATRWKYPLSSLFSCCIWSSQVSPSQIWAPQLLCLKELFEFIWVFFFSWLGLGLADLKETKLGPTWVGLGLTQVIRGKKREKWVPLSPHNLGLLHLGPMANCTVYIKIMGPGSVFFWIHGLNLTQNNLEVQWSQ